MKFNVGFRTDVGRKRKQNQDTGLSQPEIGFFLVADGMGGHRGGETASALAAESAVETIQEELKKNTLRPEAIIEKAILQANESVFQKAKLEPHLQGMGTTTTALFFNKKTLWIGHVGDSRCYFFRDGSLWQLTRDHSLVQEKLRAGLISRDQLKTDRMRNVITRSVGYEHKVTVDLYELDLHPKDTFLICSDGLTGHVTDDDIRQHIENGINTGLPYSEIVNQLVDLANSRGGEDNITAILVEYVG